MWIPQRDGICPADGESECYNDKVLQMTETGRIIKIVSSRYEVLAANQERVLCVAMGKLRKAHSPVVAIWWNLNALRIKTVFRKFCPVKMPSSAHPLPTWIRRSSSCPARIRIFQQP